MEILYKDYITFNILDQEINLISDQTDYGRNTVAEVDGELFYLGSEPPSLENAIVVWQDIHDRDLSLNEIDKIIIDNEGK
jgi:hypothetical protein